MPWSFHLHHDFCFQTSFLLHNNLVIQKISYFKIIYQSHKRCSFCIYKRECVSVFLDIWLIFFVQTSFSPMLVENNCNLIVGKLFLMYTIISEKSLWRLTFQSVVLNIHFLSCIELFKSKKIRKIVSFKK